MKIGIDCRLAGIQHAGIGRYIQNLIIRLPQQAPEHEFVYFFFDQRQLAAILKDRRHYQPLKADNLTIKFVPIKHYTLAEQLQLPHIFAQHHLDLLHVPHFNIPIFYSGKLIVTIHDLLWHHQKGNHVTTLPAWQYWLKYQAYKTVSSQAITKSHTILAPAQTIKDTICHYYPQAKSKIVVTPEGVDQTLLATYSKLKDSLPTSARKKSARSLLYVGSLYPHKNVKLVLQALTKLPQYHLTVVGTRDVFTNRLQRQIRELGVESQVSLVGSLTDQQLAATYHQATALIQPSLSEGFGLTGLEAMTLKTPVLASNIPIFKEIYQQAATYFDPYSVESLIKAIHQLEKTYAPKIKQGTKVATQYSWDKMTQQTLAAYQR